MSDGGITLERQIFSGLPQVAEILALPSTARRYVFEEGVPKYFFYRVYSADPTLSVVHVGGRSPLVRFGADSSGILVLDVPTGNVLHVNDIRQLRVSFVNATLGKFTETARLLAEQFPYGARDWFHDAKKAADAIDAIVYSVDAEAARSGAYWPDFAREIGGLMYGLDEILKWHEVKMLSSAADGVEGLEQRHIDDVVDRLF